MKAAVAHSYPRHGGPVSGSSPESERGASPCLAVIQTVRGPSLGLSSPRKLDGLRPVLFSRDELKNRRGSGPLPPRTVAIGGSERILVRSARRQSQFRLGGTAKRRGSDTHLISGRIGKDCLWRVVTAGACRPAPSRSSARPRQLFNQPLHDIVQGLPPHANPAHRHLQFVPTAVSRQEGRLVGRESTSAPFVANEDGAFQWAESDTKRGNPCLVTFP